MCNEWKKYWEERTRKNKDWYGKEEKNADEIIKELDISKKDIVLDIGCANGSHLSDIYKKTRAKCYGIDISEIAINLNRNKKIRLSVADMRKLPFENNFFTKIFSLGTIEHVPETEQVFREINRVLKKQGKLFITVPNKISFFHFTKRIKMLLGIWDLGYEKSFTKKEIIHLLEKTGFKLEKFWITKHQKVSNIFNLIDNLLNKIDNKKFGFFIFFIAKKIKDIKNVKE